MHVAINNIQDFGGKKRSFVIFRKFCNKVVSFTAAKIEEMSPARD